MPRGLKRNAETRAAVMAALLCGQSITEVARTYRLPEGTVRTWSAAMQGERLPIEPQKKGELGELLADYVREILTTLSEQARHARDRDWLRQQSADSLAVLHGVMADKTIRLLEAFGRGASADAEDPTAAAVPLGTGHLRP